MYYSVYSARRAVRVFFNYRVPSILDFYAQRIIHHGARIFILYRCIGKGDEQSNVAIENASV